MQRIKVSLYWRDQKSRWYMIYTDPSTGKRRRKTTGTDNERKALKLAGDWERELNEHGDRREQRHDWMVFREDCESQHAPSLWESSQQMIMYALNKVEGIIKPKAVCDVTTQNAPLRRCGICMIKG